MESKQKQWLPTKLRYAIIWKMSPHFRDVKIGLDFQQLPHFHFAWSLTNYVAGPVWRAHCLKVHFYQDCLHTRDGSHYQMALSIAFVTMVVFTLIYLAG